MSQTAEEFYSKFAKDWKSITGSPAYKDAIDTIHHTSESLDVTGLSLPEVAGVGHIALAKQQGALEVLNALSALADVPPEISDETPPESELYPDPLEELEQQTRTTKTRKKR